METAMRRLVRKLVQMRHDEETVVSVVSLLETEENCEKLLKELNGKEQMSKQALLVKTLLIAEPN